MTDQPTAEDPIAHALERASRAIADHDQEDYMEDCRRFDRQAKAAVLAFLKDLPYSRDPNEVRPAGMFSVRIDAYGVRHYWNAPALADAIEKVKLP